MKSTFKHFTLLVALSNLLLFQACQEKNVDSEPNNEHQQEVTVRAILAAMDAGASDQFDQYCAADFQINNPFLATSGSLKVFKGLMQGQKAGFPDVKHEVVQLFSKGNLVCVRGVFSGTNTGTMNGNPPTGNRVVVPFIFTDEFNIAGKVKVRHVQFDTGAFNAQLLVKK